MNGRQMQRSGASTALHQRQYSDNFLDNGLWLQSNIAQQVRSHPAFPIFRLILNLTLDEHLFVLLILSRDPLLVEFQLA